MSEVIKGEYNDSTIYTGGEECFVRKGGDMVSVFRAKWWTQNNSPLNDNQGVWEHVKDCKESDIDGGGEDHHGLDCDEYVDDKVYNGGEKCFVLGLRAGKASVFQAGWWTKGEKPPGNSSVWKFLYDADVKLTPPNAPAISDKFSATDKSISIAWNRPSVDGLGGVKGYEIWVNGVKNSETTAQQTRIGGLDAETSYVIEVSAYNDNGSSGRSQAVTIKTTDEKPVTGKYFSPYADVCLDLTKHLGEWVKEASLSHVTLAFITAGGGLKPAWNGAGLDFEPINAKVKAAQDAGAEITISFGGADGTELAYNASTPEELAEVYEKVMAFYGVNRLDFDIEGSNAAKMEGNLIRNKAINLLKARHPDLFVSFTIAVLPTGMVDNGVSIMRQAAEAGVKVDVLNIMAMDYGYAVPKGGMAQCAIQAATASKQQLCSVGLVDTKVGITPMIGCNDSRDETFDFDDAETLIDFVRETEWCESIGMWSLTRDRQGAMGWPSNCAYSGIEQEELGFSKAFSKLG